MRHEHEHLLVRRGVRSGLQVAVAVHSTRLGPALGGCRARPYPGARAAVDDALRLSRAMTYKAAAAGLPLGGGKAVIALPAGGRVEEAALHDLADVIDELAGSYITAEDVGTTSDDMARMARWTDHVVGRPGGAGDPGAFTARGVAAAMRACCTEVLGSRDLHGRTVAIVGLGSVGSALARLLHAAGASLALSDIDPARRASPMSSARPGWSPKTRWEPTWTCWRPAPSAASSIDVRSRACAAASSAARPTTSSATMASPSCCAGAACSTPRTSSPTPAA